MPIFRGGKSRGRSRLRGDAQSKKGSAISRGALMLWGYVLCFRYYGQGAGGFGKVNEHGVTGTTAPLLLMASMQFFSDCWARRVGFPEIVYPSIASWSHADVIKPFTVMFEHRSNALPSTKLKLTSSFNATNCADSM